MHNNKHKRQETQKKFPRGNHKGENPATSSEIEWAPMVAVKPKDRKDDLQQLFSLTCANTSSLTHAPQLSECMWQIESLTLYLY